MKNREFHDWPQTERGWGLLNEVFAACLKRVTEVMMYRYALRIIGIRRKEATIYSICDMQYRCIRNFSDAICMTMWGH